MSAPRPGFRHLQNEADAQLQEELRAMPRWTPWRGPAPPADPVGDFMAFADQLYHWHRVPPIFWISTT